MEIEITLNTTSKRFEDWLDRYRLKTLPFNIDLGDGKLLGIICAPTLDGEYQGLRRHKIKAYVTQPDPEEPSASMGSIDFPVIVLELFEPADNK